MWENDGVVDCEIQNLEDWGLLKVTPPPSALGGGEGFWWEAPYLIP